MKPLRLSFLPLLLFIGWLAIGQAVPIARADYVVLKSGGRVEGEITEENAQRVTIKVEGLGEIRFERGDVERVEYRQIRRLPTQTPPPPPATATPSPTRAGRLEPTRVAATTPTRTPRLSLGQEAPRPTLTPTPPLQARPEAPPVARAPVAPEPERPPGWPEEEFPPPDTFGDQGEESYNQGFSWDPREFNEEELQKQIETLIKGAQLFIYLIGFLFYLYLSLCRHVIATKTGTPNAWWAWIPVLRDLLLLRIGENPAWYAVLIYAGWAIQFAVSTALDLPQYAGGITGFFYSIVNLSGFLLWGFTSYVMWRDVCVARGKAKSVAYVMHLHVIFGIAGFFCCCFFPFIIVGVVCYYIICPAFIAFYK